jgi:hypothetical protein
MITLAGKYYKMRYITGQFVRECAGVTLCRAVSLCLSTGETSLRPAGTLKRALHSLSCPIARRSDISTPHLLPHYHHYHYHAHHHHSSPSSSSSVLLIMIIMTRHLHHHYNYHHNRHHHLPYDHHQLHSIISLIMHHVLPWFDFGVRVC